MVHTIVFSMNVSGAGDLLQKSFLVDDLPDIRYNDIIHLETTTGKHYFRVLHASTVVTGIVSGNMWISLEVLEAKYATIKDKVWDFTK